MRDERRRIAKPVVAALVALTVAASALVTAGPAAARTVPKGAAWFESYQLPKAWQVSEGAGVTVAVIDSRIQTTLGDLQGRTVPPVDLQGADPAFATSTNYGHGTDMAAKIAGSGAGAGMVGVAPKAKILPINVGGGGASIDADLVGPAIRAAVDRGAKVVNLSVSAPATCNPSEGAAIRYAYQRGVIVVAAAGDNPGPVGTPANCPGAIAIGGVDAAGKRWEKTPSGPSVAFVSQAFDLVDEQLDDTLGGPSPGNSGTSSASALVSGMFALLIAHFPHDSPRRIVARALYWAHTGRGAAGIDKRVDDYLGYGELLPYQALTGNTPADAANPLFDAFDQALGSASTTPGSSTAPGSSTPSTAPRSNAATDPAAATDSHDSGHGALVGIVIGVVVLVLILALVVVLRRRGGRNGPPPPGAPATGWSGGYPQQTGPPRR